MDKESAAFQVALGRDENGKTVPTIVVSLGQEEFAVMLSRAEAKELALDLLAAEAQCAGRQVVTVSRTDGNFDS